jgi:hypothetical protein
MFPNNIFTRPVSNNYPAAPRKEFPGFGRRKDEVKSMFVWPTFILVGATITLDALGIW